MIAKAKAISHGINDIRYITGESQHKKHPEKIYRVLDNLLPSEPDAMGIWNSMQLTLSQHRPIKNSVIRIELSPSPSTYQSGQLKNCYPHMEKRGSRYLRYALFNATKYVCHWDTNFAAYLAKKRAQGKHYNVAISHAAKKLVRLIFAMEKSGTPYHLTV